MPSCPVPKPGELTPPTGVPTVDFLGGQVKMQITNLWNATEGWNPTSWTRVWPDTPEGKAITRRLYHLSETKWNSIASSSDHRPVTTAIASSRWARTIGPFTVKLPVKPNETVAQYKARGGFLLWQDYFDTDTTPIDVEVPSWVGKSDPIDGFKLNVKLKQWAEPNVFTTQQIKIKPPSPPRPDLVGKWYFQVQGTVIFPDKSWWEKVKAWIVGKVRWLCNKLTSDKMQKAAVVLTLGASGLAATGIGAGPAAAMLTAAAVYQAIAAACNVAWPDCTVPSLPPAPLVPGSVGPIVPVTAPGTIAWRDSNGLYHLAVPIGLSGLKETHVETATAVSPPGGAEVVNRIAWESATKPFYRRTVFLVGSAAVAVAAAGATIALNRRRRHA